MTGDKRDESSESGVGLTLRSETAALGIETMDDRDADRVTLPIGMGDVCLDSSSPARGRSMGSI